jgi:hypothetical protein
MPYDRPWSEIHMRTLSALVAIAALTPTTALAGGFGLVASGGLHGVEAYYYNSALQQGVDNQLRPNFAGGGEVIIGDRKDRINGIMRMYANIDYNPTTPDLEGVSAADAVFPVYDETTRTDITATMGIQWGLYGDPEMRQLVLTTMFGSAFGTIDNLEYAIGDIGIGGTMMLTETIQLAGTVNGGVRYRKQFNMTEGAYLSVRYIFD